VTARPAINPPPNSSACKAKRGRCAACCASAPTSQDVARESVDDALMIVASYGPWGADLNDAHRRQIVLADEVHRLRHLYEMAVHGRAEMRAALRQERDELRAALRMVMACAGDISAAPDGLLEMALDDGDEETRRQANAFLVARAAIAKTTGATERRAA